ncbi:hypothetical protein [Streptomyces yerevanensis]|uniref:hypothetical protein n=1 Tax=Streptomyces yerevanensis TaxID=66378 RepID=UPI000A402AE9|nr:hypothetical protein [Streptomyces yerevanensis]
MNLSDLSPLLARREDGVLSYDRFRADPALASLRLETIPAVDFSGMPTGACRLSGACRLY